MGKTYSNQNKVERIKEPLLKVDRVKYRNARNSELENAETNLLKLDITRIYNQLESIDLQVLNDLTFLIGSTQDVTTSALLNDGLMYSLYDSSNQPIYYYNQNNTTIYQFQTSTVNRLSSRMVRLLNKIQRLENGQ